MSDVFDLDALVAEATGDPFQFRFGGELFELPPSMDLRVAMAASDGRIAEALTLLLGSEQMERLDDLDVVFDVAAFNGLLQAYAKHLGIGLGESQRSASSSGSTAGRLKRTSNGTTKSRSRGSQQVT